MAIKIYNHDDHSPELQISTTIDNDETFHNFRLSSHPEITITLPSGSPPELVNACLRHAFLARGISMPEFFVQVGTTDGNEPINGVRK